jgi:hypothetical protein
MVNCHLKTNFEIMSLSHWSWNWILLQRDFFVHNAIANQDG